nr:pentatricopeptide repeat-containing protein At1g62930, chloroplastic-like isoform X3 [Nicotiana tomentosiformis]
MRRISLHCPRSGIPFIYFFDIYPSCSAITIRGHSNTSISVKGKFGVSSNFENVKCLDDALTLFHQMIRTKPLPSLVEFSKLYKTMLSMKHYSAVVSLFGEMQKSYIQIDGFILSIVINSYCLMHRVDCGFSVLPIYLKNGIPFNVVTFNTLIRGFFAENKVKDAVNLFKKLAKEKICEPNEVMYGTVMNGLSKRGHTQKTLTLLRLMEVGKTKPNIHNYNIVIDALCKDRNLDAAINLLNEMKQKVIPPDIVTYNSLIDGLCKLGQWEKVRTLFAEMVNFNIYPNVRTFTMVIDGLCKEGKVEDAEEVMRHMNEKGVEPNIFTYNVIMDGYCLCGQMDRARRIFDFMIDKSIEPDIICYNVLINGYCKKKKLAEAMQMFREISQKRPKPNMVTYNTILQGLFEVGRIGSAKQVFAEMLSTGPIPDLCTHTTLLDGYFKYGLVEEAMSYFNKLEIKRVSRDIGFYNAVINGLCKNDPWKTISQGRSSMQRKLGTL